MKGLPVVVTSLSFSKRLFDSQTGDELKVKLTKVILTGLLMLSGRVWAQETQPPPIASSQPAPDPSLKNNTAGFLPGDLITVRMFDFPELGGPLSVHVDADGSIRLPYAGTIQAVGLRPDALQKAIVEALKSRGIVKEPAVTVETINATNLNVTVMGQVLTPKTVPLFAAAPLAYVLGQVGGVTGLASPHLTIIHYGDRAPTSVEWDPETADSKVLNTMVEPGDIINVSARGVYFIEGEVNRPGIYPLAGAINVGNVTPIAGLGVVKTVTLLQALAQAGGITQIAARSKMHILRSDGGKREDIVVDQVKLSKGEVADPILHPNDIIYLPPSYFRQQTNNLFNTGLSSLYAATSVKANGFY